MLCYTEKLLLQGSHQTQPHRISTLNGSCPEATIHQRSDAAFKVHPKGVAGVFLPLLTPEQGLLNARPTSLLTPLRTASKLVYRKSARSQQCFLLDTALWTQPSAPARVVLPHTFHSVREGGCTVGSFTLIYKPGQKTSLD